MPGSNIFSSLKTVVTILNVNYLSIYLLGLFYSFFYWLVEMETSVYRQALPNSQIFT